MGFLRRAKLSDPIAVPFSKRSVVNLSFILDVAHYPFINHVLECDNFPSPNGSAWTGATPTWPQVLDQTTGYPNNAAASGRQWGGGLKFPDASKFAGPYVITWDGTGTLTMNGPTWVESNNTGTTYTKNSNGNWTNVAGKSAYIIASMTPGTWAGAPNILGFYFNTTGGADGFVRNFRVYRLADEGDLLAGRVFRRPFLQQIVDHDPSALRVMNWSGGNDGHGMRFENRTMPNYASYGNGAGWVNSPLYGTTTGTNQYSLAAVTTGVKQTPALMQHGEIVTCRMGASTTASTNTTDVVTISAVTTTATPRVTTAVPHGFSSSQIIYHVIKAGTGVPKLDCFPAMISVVNTTQYDITNLSLVGQAAYTGTGPSIGSAYVYVSLNVGVRGDFPIVFSSGAPGAASYGAGYIKVDDHQTFYFDKNIIGKSDGAGNYVKGVWIFMGGGSASGHWDGVPLEVLTKLIIELNQMGPTSPISMWISYPHRAMNSSLDPDYSAGSNWAVNATNVILNGNTVGGTVWPGLLTGATGATLYIEYCNELWNPTSASTQRYYIQNYAWSRWGDRTISFQDGHMLRAVAMMRDIKAAYPTETRIKLVMGLWGAQGMHNTPSLDGAANYAQWNGNATVGGAGNWYTTDTLGATWGPPKNYYDAVAIAPYFEPNTAYYSGTGAGSFTDDSAMYAGTAPYAGAPNQTQALTNFINGAVTQSGGPGTNQWLTIQDEFVAQMGSAQFVTNYEGGGNWWTNTGQDLGGGHIITAADTTFLVAAYRCAQMGTALVNYFNAVCAKPKSVMPAVYLSVNAGYRWSFAAPDSYATTSTEGGALTGCPAWMALNTRNASIT